MGNLFTRGFFFSMGISYYTKEGLDKLRSELNHLKDVERPNASKAIAEARDKGDLSENAEYDAAKEAQGLLELKISKLEETLSNARLIDESQLDTSKILVLSKVKPLFIFYGSFVASCGVHLCTTILSWYFEINPQIEIIYGSLQSVICLLTWSYGIAISINIGALTAKILHFKNL